MIKVGVIGATGYAGAELVRLLAEHEEVKLEALASRSNVGSPFWEVYPHLYGYLDLCCEEINLPSLVERCDLIFTALPYGYAVEVAEEVVKRGKKLIDLGADFRFSDVDIYEKWYKVEHGNPELLKRAVYGLPELFRNKILDSQILANPGCYPTASILSLAPLFKNNLVDSKNVIIDAKSGVSGAGRGLSLNSHYCEVNESIKAYGVASHRHTPEIEQAFSVLSGEDVLISFTPHLTPMTRGILATSYAFLKNSMKQEEILALYKDFYKDEFFVKVLPKGMIPATKNVVGSNYCQIAPVLDERTGKVIVLSVIDNLIKGAAGQAVQNMNLMFGFSEQLGIKGVAMHP